MAVKNKRLAKLLRASSGTTNKIIPELEKLSFSQQSAISNPTLKRRGENKVGQQDLRNEVLVP